jgi:hypothetical protein
VRDYNKYLISELTPEQQDNIKEDILNHPELTIDDICEKHLITISTYNRFKERCRHYFEEGHDRQCSSCGEVFKTYSRGKTVCLVCDKHRKTRKKPSLKQKPGPKKGIIKTIAKPKPKPKPNLILGREYKFRDVSYLDHVHGNLVTKTGKLIQVTDYFAVFDIGNYKTAIHFRNIGGVAC